MARKGLAHVWFALLSLGLSLGMLCAIGSAAPPQSEDRVRIVGKSGISCPNAQYATISDAVNAAAPGDEIDICPALYAEQLLITKPLTLRGIRVDDTLLAPAVPVNRVLLQPSTLQDLGGLGVEAVITVMNTQNVTIENLAIDARNNNVSTCAPGLADIHYFNASGNIKNDAISGAQLTNPKGCVAIFPGNGFGVLVDSDQPGPFHVSVEHNSIHDYTKDGIQATTAGVTLEVRDNTISGAGPSGGFSFQFGVFLVNGAAGAIERNVITEGLCGTLSYSDCLNQRSEGVTLRAAGDGTVVSDNVITDAQSGIFINGGNQFQIVGNTIRNIDALSGMDIRGSAATGPFTNSVISGNTISNVGPITENFSIYDGGCGIIEYPGTGVSGNTILHNTVNDSYCGVGHVTADHVVGGVYYNTLYNELNSDLYPNTLPPSTEP
jgi:nitrous oxidase accessory protein NosD